ncbi:MAG TPA: LacI family DNA-binding transcriptional regulator [Candidatus Limnocylindria bacterium]|jgi:LacI family repressor for deo operon, udp, cdd, tsx, nupC, and nupG|nr:LacI family DNA-binding transcriptional regulator [Candidatus Limnocylindria bacterium]
MKRATIRDVAKRARVSHQTVSRVINGNDSVSAETRERVTRAIAELQYVPSAVARSLSSSRTHTLGMVTTDVSDHFFAEAVAGAEAAARKRGYFLIIGSIEPGAEDDERTYLRLMLERRVEGLIIAVPRLRLADDDLLVDAASRLPTVVVASDIELPGADHVDIDNRQGGFEATGYLLAQGHRRIATITGPLDWPSARARLDGYRDALRRAVGAAEPLVEPCLDWGLESGLRAAERLLAAAPRPTAIFAQSDLLALGAMSALRAHGVRVPEDMSMVGFDDIPVAQVFDPPLTTLRQPMREVGELATRLVLEPPDGTRRGKAARHHVLRAPLVVRGSVAKLRREGDGEAAKGSAKRAMRT